MKYKLFLSFALVFCANINSVAQSSFDEFRSEILGNYNSFRSEILSNYRAFLDDIWEEHKQIVGEKRADVPKPSMAPKVEKDDPADVATTVNHPEKISNPILPEKEVAPSLKDTPRIDPSANTVCTLVDFFDIPIEVETMKFDIHKGLDNVKDYGLQWADMEAQNVAKCVVPTLQKKASEMGLNGYLTYRFIKAFVDSRFPQSDATARMAATHYLLLNTGYDARIAIDGNGVPLLMLNCAQTVYGQRYTTIDGAKYYIFADNDYYQGCKTLQTCVLPKDAEVGAKVDFLLSKLNIPYSPQSYNVEFGDISISGEYNRNLYSILHRYPQLPIDAYAVSSPDPDLRQQVCRQVAAALQGMDRDKAVDALLDFTQHGFAYATDEDNHGFEKPYFFEEMVYYDKCDCEDRAIFYSYLLWNVLGVPCHVINYPGHESVAVRLDGELRGTRYRYDDAYFYISDPTYIGASTGMCMKKYIDATPEIDYEYK